MRYAFVRSQTFRCSTIVAFQYTGNGTTIAYHSMVTKNYAKATDMEEQDRRGRCQELEKNATRVYSGSRANEAMQALTLRLTVYDALGEQRNQLPVVLVLFAVFEELRRRWSGHLVVMRSATALARAHGQRQVNDRGGTRSLRGKERTCKAAGVFILRTAWPSTRKFLLHFTQNICSRALKSSMLCTWTKLAMHWVKHSFADLAKAWFWQAR